MMGIALTDWVGLAGSALILVAYFLNQRGELASSDWRFPALNLAGASLILFSLMFAWNLPSAMQNGHWGSPQMSWCLSQWRTWALVGAPSSPMATRLASWPCKIRVSVASMVDSEARSEMMPLSRLM